MKRIGIYAGKNLLRIILLLFAVSILTFALVSASPIDPLQANVGQAALGSMSEEQKEKLRSYWGVDEPPVQRYLNWLNAFIKGDGGISLLYRQPVTKVIAVKLGNSLFLMGLACMNYDICYNSASYGIEESVDIIERMLNQNTNS